MLTPTKLFWRSFNQLTRAHTVAYKASRGLVGHHIPGIPPMLLLDHVGAKTGKKRTTPVAYMQIGDDTVIVASQGGRPRNPGWYHNLRANPDTTIQIGSRRIPVRAKVASPQKRSVLWPKVVEMYGGFEGYQKRTERQIPLVVLEPRE